jgi:glycosyltransferase involved in cell wall biosynthesis
MAAAGRARAVERYSLDKVAERLADWLQHLSHAG